MANKQLSQAGLNRVIWHLLRTQNDGKFTIPESAIMPNPEAAVKIQYDSSTKSFILSAHVINPLERKESTIILPNGLLN